MTSMHSSGYSTTLPVSPNTDFPQTMTFNLSINNENNSGEKRESPGLHIETLLANHRLLLVLLYIVSFVQWRDIAKGR